MPRSRLRLLILLLVMIAQSSAAYGEESTMNVARFGTVNIYRPASSPKHVALFISGDGGWNLGVVEMARELEKLDTLVIGIDITRYLKTLERSKQRCEYAAADFESLSQQVQQKLGLHNYEYPVVVGYSSGATLAYAIAVQAPQGTFRGAVSLGFTTDLLLKKPLCSVNGLRYQPMAKDKGIDFLPAPAMRTPWVVLQGDIDQVALPKTTAAFVAQIPTARMILLPKVGHGFSVPAHWMPQFKKAFIELATHQAEQTPPPDTPLQGLPLVEVPAAPGTASDYLALMVTGDGGWAGLDQGIAAELSRTGVPVIGLNSLKYFWTPRNAATTARDMERIARHYLAAWNKQRLLLIGYSFGADVLPFAVEKFPADLQQRVAMMTLIGPDDSATFEFHVSDWIGGSFAERGEPIRPVLERLHGTPPTLCIYGREETHSLCRTLSPALVRSVEVKGAHHYGGDYTGLTRHILDALKQ